MLRTSNSVHQPDVPIWQTCLTYISEKIGSSSFETWFRSTDLAFSDNGSPKILVPNQFFADFIEEHFSTVITEALTNQGISALPLSFVSVQKDWKIIEPIQESITLVKTPRIIPSNKSKRQFHPNYVFDKFIIGDNNRMAQAAALAVAEAPGKTTFNPLIIYGSTGLGKTHLLQSIGHFAQSESTASNVTYLTSEDFTNQYIGYVIEKKDSTSFYKQFKDTDLLLIDDIQFFSGKQGTQKEFFRIFNKLLLENKQIVLSSDRSPDKIPDMMHHIINRFMGGLITDIQPPNLETRMAILRKKVEMDGLMLDDAVIEYIASHITSNIRELEGILIKLIASASFTGRDITLDVAREICGDIIAQKELRLSIEHIQNQVAQAFNISVNQITAHSSKREVTLPRYAAMYLCKKWTRQSLRTIGLQFGGRDYSTVIHACKRMEITLSSDPALQETIATIESNLASFS